MTPNDGVVSKALLGKTLRGARAITGMTVPEVAQAIHAAVGYSVSDETLYRLERGEREISLNLFAIMLIVLDPPGGMGFFANCFDPEARGKLIPGA